MASFSPFNLELYTKKEVILFCYGDILRFLIELFNCVILPKNNVFCLFLMY